MSAYFSNLVSSAGPRIVRDVFNSTKFAVFPEYFPVSPMVGS